MEFSDQFRQWLEQALADTPPAPVQAFAFNLLDYGIVADDDADGEDAMFGIELTGAASFDAADPDWACDEIWEPAVRVLDIPVAFSGSDWESCLRQVDALLRAALLQDDRLSRLLTSRHGIGLGFVDGDLTVLWAA